MTRKLVVAIAVAGYAMLHIPLLLLIAWSFNASPSGARWAGFTLDWYRALWHRADLFDALRTSLIVGISATIIATAIGTMGALGLGRKRWRTTQFVEGVLLFPIVTPEVVAGISILILFAAAGIRLGLVTVIIAHATFCIPFTMLVVLARLRGMDHTLEDAALSLGADEFAAFRRITFPLILPGIVSAALLAFTLSFDDFIITFFTAGPGTSTLPLVVYGMVRRTVEPTVNALSALLVVGTTLLLVAAQRWMGGEYPADTG
ncbi:MAG TPA: ABC transporter permease [Gemmatimonadales bacterium]|jgi:spermidine/putrescine transport system permease protein